ncbi:hypothetical protein ACVWWN_001624 [Mycobacterium sp. URHB0021]
MRIGTTTILDDNTPSVANYLVHLDYLSVLNNHNLGDLARR